MIISYDCYTDVKLLKVNVTNLGPRFIAGSHSLAKCMENLEKTDVLFVTYNLGYPDLHTETLLLDCLLFITSRVLKQPS